MEKGSTQDAELFRASYCALDGLPTGDEFSRICASLQQNRKKLIAAVDEIIKGLDCDRAAAIAQQKEKQTQISSLKGNISTLQKRVARRTEQLTQWKEEVAGVVDELEHTEAHRRQADVLADHYEKKAAVLRVQISNAWRRVGKLKNLTDEAIDSCDSAL
ncbi:hypothetical protein Tcan_07889 [Toxocara canis]|uniref:Uncharacterized protein n=1 Tax=Toxocara canis TaxID=6265 RepID=A0A0B2VTR4_TOXCA|nr:hypothetical protein Tcan_07889 [Toxocara canis]